MEQSELEPVFMRDASKAGSCFTHYASVLAPFFPSSCGCVVFIPQTQVSLFSREGLGALDWVTSAWFPPVTPALAVQLLPCHSLSSPNLQPAPDLAQGSHLLFLSSDLPSWQEHGVSLGAFSHGCACSHPWRLCFLWSGFGSVAYKALPDGFCVQPRWGPL